MLYYQHLTILAYFNRAAFHPPNYERIMHDPRDLCNKFFQVHQLLIRNPNRDLV